MKHIAVLGAGPAGAYAAERLAGAGLRVTLIDEKLAWEKPCGGGLTYKAYNQYPFLLHGATPKKALTRTRLSSPVAGFADLELRKPLLIYSRHELNDMLIRRAAEVGAQLEKVRVTGLERAGAGWSLKTQKGAIAADYCVVANGARNALSHVGTEWSAGNKMVALGYYIPVNLDRIDIQFLPGFSGYIWVFPRNGHVSAGICAKGVNSQVLRRRLEEYLSKAGIPLTGATFYGHVIPSLTKPEWRTNRVAGNGWMAVGDAAGLVDPVTGEGLYYAIRSADMAAEALLADGGEPEPAYRASLEREFTDELELASRLAARLYLGKFLYGDVPMRMIQFMRRSPTFCDVLQDLFAGTQGYLDLKARLLGSVRGTLRDMALGLFGKQAFPAPK